METLPLFTERAWSSASLERMRQVVKDIGDVVRLLQRNAPDTPPNSRRRPTAVASGP